MAEDIVEEYRRLREIILAQKEAVTAGDLKKLARLTADKQAAMEKMDPIDREVLALRHFEELTNGEAAEVLGIQHNAASMRYVRALTRLKDILSQIPGFSDDDEAGPESVPSVAVSVPPVGSVSAETSPEVVLGSVCAHDKFGRTPKGQLIPKVK